MERWLEVNERFTILGREGRRRRMLFAGILVVDLAISRQDQFEETMVCVCVIWE